MKPVIYVDLLFLVNFIISYFLLLATSKLTGAPLSTARLISGSCLSALSAIVLIFPALGVVLAFIYKLLSAVLVIFVSFGKQNLRCFLRQLGWFFLLHIGLGGLMLAASQSGFLSGVRENNFFIYVHISPFLLLISVLLFYILIRSLVFFFGKPLPLETYQLAFNLMGCSVHLTAFYDSGFFLSEPIQNLPAVMVSWHAARHQLAQEPALFVSSYFNGSFSPPPSEYKFRLVPCRFAGAQAILPGFICSDAMITGRKSCFAVKKLLVVFCSETFHNNAFEALFGSEFLQFEKNQGGY